MKSNGFEDFKVNTRLKLSALWTSVMFCYIYGNNFELYIPKTIEGLINGHGLLDTSMKLFAAAIMLTIPALMIFLFLILKPKLSRLLDIIFGIFFTLLMLLIAAFSLTECRTFYVFLAIVESIITSLIIWQAWSWKKINSSFVLPKTPAAITGHSSPRSF